jgi:hypothetical protein
VLIAAPSGLSNPKYTVGAPWYANTCIAHPNASDRLSMLSSTQNTLQLAPADFFPFSMLVILLLGTNASFFAVAIFFLSPLLTFLCYNIVCGCLLMQQPANAASYLHSTFATLNCQPPPNSQQPHNLFLLIPILVI